MEKLNIDSYYILFIEPKPLKLENSTDNEISRSKQGVKIWKDRTDTFKKLPSFLDGKYFFRTPTKGNKGKTWTIQVYGPSKIYLIEKTDKSVGKDWLKKEGSVITSSDSLTKIWVKNLEDKGISRIVLQPITSDDIRRIIFITGNRGCVIEIYYCPNTRISPLASVKCISHNLLLKASE